jgi:RHS repeat-associated protein
MQLYYNTGTNKQYNGNIAYQYWGTPGNLNNNYTYTYDKLNRLTSGKSANFFNEQGITYDLMGNITALNRYQAGTLIDQLLYDYGGGTSTRLQVINDLSSNDLGLQHGGWNYTYDGNGNLVTSTSAYNSAWNKSTTYNLFNLPLVASIPSGNATFTYDANGNKLRKVAVINGVTTATEYISGIQYKNSTTAVDFIQTEEGRTVPNGTGYDYQYYLGDNLGNTRVTFGTKTGAAVAYQQDDYYPFGMEINRNVLSPKNEYLYNKKELQEETGLYDFGARGYDPVIARWTTIDPLAENDRRWSSYTYVLNNPIRMIDPDGMNVIYNPDGSVTYNNEGGSDDATNFATGLKIAGDHTKQEKDDDRKKAKEREEQKRVGNVMLRAIQAFGDAMILLMTEGNYDGEATEATEETEATVEDIRSIWASEASERGFEAERRLGGNLPYGFPVVDRFADGDIVTSIKSIDVTAQSYKEGNALLNTLKGYIRKVAGFQGGRRQNFEILNTQITGGRALELVIQPGKASPAQFKQIGEAIKFAKANNVQMTIKYIK